MFLVFLDSFVSFLILAMVEMVKGLLAERQLWPRSTNISPPNTPSVIARRESSRQWPDTRRNIQNNKEQQETLVKKWCTMLQTNIGNMHLPLSLSIYIYLYTSLYIFLYIICLYCFLLLPTWQRYWMILTPPTPPTMKLAWHFRNLGYPWLSHTHQDRIHRGGLAWIRGDRNP